MHIHDKNKSNNIKILYIIYILFGEGQTIKSKGAIHIQVDKRVTDKISSFFCFEAAYQDWLFVA